MRGASYTLIWEFCKTLGNYPGMLSLPPQKCMKDTSHNSGTISNISTTLLGRHIFIQVSRIKRTGPTEDQPAKCSLTGKHAKC